MVRNRHNSHRKHIGKEKFMNMLFSILLRLLCKSIIALYGLEEFLYDLNLKTWIFKVKRNVSMTYKYYQIICA